LAAPLKIRAAKMQRNGLLQTNGGIDVESSPAQVARPDECRGRQMLGAHAAGPSMLWAVEQGTWVMSFWPRVILGGNAQQAGAASAVSAEFPLE